MENERRGSFQEVGQKSKLEKKQEKFAGIINNVLSKQNEEEILADIEHSNPNLHKYLLETAPLRVSLHREFLKTPQNKLRYFQGAAIMDKAEKINYRSQGKKPPKLGRRILQTTFQDLTGAEDTHYEADILNNLARRSLETPLSPQTVTELPRFDTQTDASRTLWKNIVEKTNNAYEDFLIEQNSLVGMMKEKTTNLDNYIDNEINREKFPEYIYGALDVHLAYKMHDESRGLRELYRR